MGEPPRLTDLGDALSLCPLGQDDRSTSEMALTLESLQCVRQLLGPASNRFALIVAVIFERRRTLVRVRR